MMSGKFHGWRVAALLLALGGAVLAGNFAPPAEGPAAFRRDQVPLDVQSMTRLSRQLVTLARGLDGKSAAQRRAVAQMLALSVALDPANAGARSLIAAYESGTRPPADLAAAAKEQPRIWQLIEWLETPEAGPGGHALAACLMDVAVASRPRFPQAEALQGSPERGAWGGWIPALSAYEAPVSADTSEPETTQEPAQEPAQEPTVGAGLAQARVITPLWSKNPTGEWILSPAPLLMTAAPSEPEEDERPRFSLVLASPENGSSLRRIVPTILDALTSRHGKLPSYIRVTIAGEALQTSLLSRKSHSVSAAAAVLASAAISGREPAEATIIGEIDANGAFNLPANFWEQLRSLDRGDGGRVVLPTAAAEFLPSLLALEMPLFFIKHEILLASNFEQLVERSAKASDPSLAGASAKFLDLRAKLQNQDIGHHLTNSFVRRRLAEIREEAPFHHSAAMLAMQGAGERPVQVIRPVLIGEIRRALEPLEWLVERGYVPSSEQKRLGSSLETCRLQLDSLDRCCAKEDRALLSSAQSLMNTLRGLERRFKSRGYVSYSAFKAFDREYADLESALAQAAGDDEPRVRVRVRVPIPAVPVD